MNRAVQKKRKFYGGRCLWLCLFMLLTLFPVSVSAEEAPGRRIRVGSFEATYNRINEKGERSGYGYEYLQNIAGYAGWTYEYVTSNWTDCFTQLENGEIDVLGGISYTEERAESMLFSDVPMGEEKYYIYTNAANTQLSAADLDSFDGTSIGVLLDHTPETVLKEWEAKHGLHMQHVDISTTEEILEKLANREISCFVSVEESYWADLDISPVTNIGESNIYFVINRDRPDIKDAIDSAMRRIRDDNPFYTDDLYRKYLSAQSSAFLSQEEKDWIARHGAIRIGYLNGDTGVSVLDPATGELTGVITDYVTLAKNCLQGQTLDFELKGYTTRSAQLEALYNDEIDLIFHVSQNPYFAETNHFVLSDTVWTFNLAASAEAAPEETPEMALQAAPRAIVVSPEEEISTAQPDSAAEPDMTAVLTEDGGAGTELSSAVEGGAGALPEDSGQEALFKAAALEESALAAETGSALEPYAALNDETEPESATVEPENAEDTEPGAGPEQASRKRTVWENSGRKGWVFLALAAVCVALSGGVLWARKKAR